MSMPGSPQACIIQVLRISLNSEMSLFSPQWGRDGCALVRCRAQGIFNHVRVYCLEEGEEQCGESGKEVHFLSLKTLFARMPDQEGRVWARGARLFHTAKPQLALHAELGNIWDGSCLSDLHSKGATVFLTFRNTLSWGDDSSVFWHGIQISDHCGSHLKLWLSVF